MPALIDTDAIAGPFTLQYTPPSGSILPLGVIGPEGIRLTRQYSAEPIFSDQYGRDTLLNGVYTGGTLFLEFLLQEANKSACKLLAYPHNETVGGVTGSVKAGLEHELGTPGTLLSAAAGSLVATPVLGTPAAAESTPVRTFSLIILAPGHSIDYFLRAGLKTFPIRLVALPYTSSSKQVWFTRSALS